MRIGYAATGIGVLLAATAFCQEPLVCTIDLKYSSDDGKTWASDFPEFASPQEFLLKAAFSSNEKRPIENGVVMASLHCEQRDFASATRGLQQNWLEGGRAAWFQSGGHHGYKNPTFVFKVDLRARPEGVVGHANKRDKGAFTDGPLPACPEFSPGAYRFTAKVYYRLADTVCGIKDGGELINTCADFMVSIGKGAVPSSSLSIQAPQAKKAGGSLPDARVEYPLPQPGGDYVFPISKLKTVLGEGLAPAEYIDTKRRDLNWQVSDVPAGDYYIRLVVECGFSGPFLYLNGTPVHFKGMTAPVLHRGRWFAVIESAVPETLREGDALRLNGKNQSAQGRLGPRFYGNNPPAFGSLSLSKTPMDGLISAAGDFVGPYHDDRVRIDGGFSFSADGLAVFKTEIVNMGGRAGKFSLKCRVVDYFQAICAEETVDVDIPYGGMAKRALSFRTGGSDRYLASVEVTDSAGAVTDAEYETLAEKNEGLRRKIWLISDWDCTALKDAGPFSRSLDAFTGPPPSATNVTVDLPYSFKVAEKEAHLAWYQKRFMLPASWAGQRVFIHIDRASYESRLMINGRKVAEMKPGDGFGPFDIDITDQVQPGATNAVIIALRDDIAMLDARELQKDKLPDTGSRPALGEIWLSLAPRTRITDVFVQTSFRKKEIAAQVKTAAAVPGAVLSARVLRQGTAVYAFKDVPAQSGATWLTGTWAQPPLWGPTNFPLLNLEITLRDASGNILDTSETRFGFREIWAQGMDLMWNGKTVKFASRPFLNTWPWGDRFINREMLRMARKGGVRMLRHIYNANEYTDIADEAGLIMAMAPGIAPAGLTQKTIADDDLWKTIEATSRGGILGMRNHPSIFTWYLSNECMGQSEEPQRKRLQALGEKMLALDRTRFIEFGCDIDLRGVTDIISTHYPVDFFVCRTDRAWLPEAAYWRRFDQSFEKGMAVPAGQLKGVANVFGQSPITWGVKPVIINECCFVEHNNPPNGLSKIGGDTVYTPAGMGEADNQFNRLMVQGHRDAGVSAITLWRHVHGDPTYLASPEADMVVLQKIDKFYGGSKPVYDVNLFHDLFQESGLTFDWRLKNGSSVLDSGVETLKADFCSLFRRRITLRLPKVKTETRLSLELTLGTPDEVLCRRAMPVTVYPRLDADFAAGTKTVIFDPNGTSAAELCTALPGIVRVEDLTPQRLEGVRLLIIGREIPGKAMDGARKIMEDYVTGGGTVMVLPQKDCRSFMPGATIATDLNASLCFTFRKDHPLLEGIQESELSYWGPDHKAADNCYVKPSRGNFRTAVEAGGLNGLVYAALWDAAIGRGSVIFCQMNIDTTLALNPVAMKLWRNIFTFAAAPKPELKPAGYIGGAGFKSALQSAGVSLKDVLPPAALNDCAALTVDASEPLGADNVALIRTFLDNGGLALLHGVNDSSRQSVSAVCGTDIVVDAAIPRDWRGRLLLLKNDPLTSGLNNFDFFWNNPDYGDMAARIKASAVAIGPGTARLSGLGFKALCYPEFMVQKTVGKGSVYLDALSFTDLAPELQENVRRALLTLLNNAGVKIESGAAATRDYFGGMSFEPLDIARFMNREFADAVENDGQGGWTDQGPEADLRDFTVAAGVHTFKDVPFMISRPLGCLVLASPNRRNGPPEQVELPVGRKCGALYMLHSCAWTGRAHHASYIVNYADGTSHDIKIVGGVNMLDWASSNAEAPFPGETETLSKAAVLIKHKRVGTAAMYQMAWLNPFPEKEIKSVTFKSMNKGVPVLVALTAGVRAGERRTAIVSPSDRAAGTAFVAEAQAMLKTGKTNEAEVILRKAIAADPDNHASYIHLGYRLQERRLWDQAIAMFRKSLDVYPKDLEPYMQMGKCYEEMGDWRSAVKTYRESLAADLNQPPIRAALEAAEKKRADVEGLGRK